MTKNEDRKDWSHVLFLEAGTVVGVKMFRKTHKLPVFKSQTFTGGKTKEEIKNRVIVMFDIMCQKVLEALDIEFEDISDKEKAKKWFKVGEKKK